MCNFYIFRPFQTMALRNLPISQWECRCCLLYSMINATKVTLLLQCSTMPKSMIPTTRAEKPLYWDFHPAWLHSGLDVECYLNPDRPLLPRIFKNQLYTYFHKFAPILLYNIAGSYVKHLQAMTWITIDRRSCRNISVAIIFFLYCGRPHAYGISPNGWM